MGYSTTDKHAIEYVVKNSVEIAEKFDSMFETRAREIIGAVAKAYQIDRFLGTVHLVRNARELARAVMFHAGKFDKEFVEIVAEAAAMDFLGDYSERGFNQKSIPDEERRAYETLSRLQLGLDVTVFAIESAYKALRKYNCLVQTMLNSEAATRAANANVVTDAAPDWLQFARDIAEAECNLVGAKAIGYWMDAIAVAFEYDSRLKKHGEYDRAWKPLAEWLKNARRIPAIDIGEINREYFPAERKLLRYIDQQMGRMNYEHAAACMINWLPELEKMVGYVSRETSLTFKCARVK